MSESEIEIANKAAESTCSEALLAMEQELEDFGILFEIGLITETDRDARIAATKERIEQQKEADKKAQEAADAAQKKAEEDAAKKEESKRLAKEKADKTKAGIVKHRKKIIVAAAIVVAIMAGLVVYTKVVSPAMTYSSAISKVESKDYQAAIDMFEELGDYKDAPRQALIARLAYADVLVSKKEFDKAYPLYDYVLNHCTKADDYDLLKEATEKATSCRWDFVKSVNMEAATDEQKKLRHDLLKELSDKKDEEATALLKADYTWKYTVTYLDASKNSLGTTPSEKARYIEVTATCPGAPSELVSYTVNISAVITGKTVPTYSSIKLETLPGAPSKQVLLTLNNAKAASASFTITPSKVKYGVAPDIQRFDSIQFE